MAAEGFIPEPYQAFSGFDATPWLRVTWIVDNSWKQPEVTRWPETDRFMIRLMAGAFALWLGLLAALFLK